VYERESARARERETKRYTGRRPISVKEGRRERQRERERARERERERYSDEAVFRNIWREEGEDIH
jgi:hypothetical protein